MDAYYNRLRKERLKLGLTQEQVANELGVHKTNISGIENGRTENTPLKYLLYLAKKGIDMNELFKGQQEETDFVELFEKTMYGNDHTDYWKAEYDKLNKKYQELLEKVDKK